jgi:hypothetical protein
MSNYKLDVSAEALLVRFIETRSDTIVVSDLVGKENVNIVSLLVGM